MSQPVITVTDLYKQYETVAGPVPVLKGVNLTVNRGEFVAIMGTSGSGKSTFMNILGCLDEPTQGSYVLNGINVRGQSIDELAAIRNRTIWLVFQSFNLLERSTLIKKVALPLVYAKVPTAERQEHAREMLARVGLSSAADRRPNQISGGQQQRVAIARALVNAPSLILADEPTGNLDTGTSHEILKLFQQLNSEGITIVLVTHEPSIALFAKRLVRFANGKVFYDGPSTRDALEKEAPDV